MDDLTAFVTARLDEDEAAATAAHPGPWTLDEWTGGFGRMACVMMPFGPAAPDAKTGLTALAKLGTQDYETARHIARHDPLRVLREVAVKRAIVRQWQHSPADSPVLTFALYQLAAVYSDHPDYRQEWAP